MRVVLHARGVGERQWLLTQDFESFALGIDRVAFGPGLFLLQRQSLFQCLALAVELFTFLGELFGYGLLIVFQPATLVLKL